MRSKGNRASGARQYLNESLPRAVDLPIATRLLANKEGAMKWLVLFVGALAVFSPVDTEAGEWRYNYLDHSYEYVDALGDPKVSATYDYNAGDWEFKTPTQNKVQPWQLIYNNPFDEGEYPSALQGLRRGYESALTQQRYNRASEQLELALLLSLLDTQERPAIKPSRESVLDKYDIDLRDRPRARMAFIEKTFDWLDNTEKKNDWMISGKLENRGNGPAWNVWAYVTVYDTMGILITAEATVCFPCPVMPGDTTYFIILGTPIPSAYEGDVEWEGGAKWDK